MWKRNASSRSCHSGGIFLSARKSLTCVKIPACGICIAALGKSTTAGRGTCFAFYSSAAPALFQSRRDEMFLACIPPLSANSVGVTWRWIIYALPFFMHKTFHSYGVLRAFESASYKHGTPPEFFRAAPARVGEASFEDRRLRSENRGVQLSRFGFQSSSTPRSDSHAALTFIHARSDNMQTRQRKQSALARKILAAISTLTSALPLAAADNVPAAQIFNTDRRHLLPVGTSHGKFRP